MIAELERMVIEAVLRAQPSKAKAAKALGVSTKTLYNKVAKYKRDSRRTWIGAVK